MSTCDRRQFLAASSATTAALVTSPVHSEIANNGTIKIGQLGTGHAHATRVFKQLRQVTDEFELVGIAEDNQKRRKQLGGTFQGVKLSSEEELLNTKGLQAVVIETEVQDLLPSARRCVDAGMHIHLDKPAGENLPDFKNLLDEIQRRKIHLQMGYIYRYHPAFQFCYQAVAEGWLGDVFEIHSVMSKKVSPEQRVYISRFAGGSMFEIGCHVIDAMIRVKGKPQKTTTFGRQTHADQDPLVDNQLAVFEYPDAIASIRSALIEYAGSTRRQFSVCGEFGTFDLKPLRGNNFRLALERPRGQYKKGYQDVTLPDGPRGFVSAFKDMAAIIRGEKQNDYPPSHELAVHETILRASGYRVDK